MSILISMAILLSVLVEKMISAKFISVVFQVHCLGLLVNVGFYRARREVMTTMPPVPIVMIIICSLLLKIECWVVARLCFLFVYQTIGGKSGNGFLENGNSWNRLNMAFSFL